VAEITVGRSGLLRCFGLTALPVEGPDEPETLALYKDEDFAIQQHSADVDNTHHDPFAHINSPMIELELFQQPSESEQNRYARRSHREAEKVSDAGG